MKWFLSKIISPAVWRRVALRMARRLKSEWLRWRLHRQCVKLGPVARGMGSTAIIADGLWDNPNHFFRLRLFLEAIPDIDSQRLIGILNHADDRTRSALEDLGFTEFIAIDDHPVHQNETYVAQARALLAKVGSHADLLALDLPGGLPAYTYYDSVLKQARHPQPPLDDPLWESVLATSLRNCAIYEDLLEDVPVAHVVLSHPWGGKYASLAWAALLRAIPTYHLTGYCEGIRIRRFRATDDYATPVEQLTLGEFLALPQSVQDKLSDEGGRYLTIRETGEGTDINALHAFAPKRRASSRAEARRAFGVDDDRTLAIIYAHVWFDFPHSFAMDNFTDFLDWIRFTVDQLRDIHEIAWILKPHPTEGMYGGFRLRDMADELPSNVRLAPSNTDSLNAMNAADVVVTVHGTIGLEAAAHGLPVIAADRSFYSDWGFVHLASSRDHYRDLLHSAGDLTGPDAVGMARAKAMIALALAPAPEAVGALKIRCDSSGTVLYKDIIHRYNGAAHELKRESGHITKWLGATASSYAANAKVEHFSP